MVILFVTMLDGFDKFFGEEGMVKKTFGAHAGDDPLCKGYLFNQRQMLRSDN